MKNKLLVSALLSGAFLVSGCGDENPSAKNEAKNSSSTQDRVTLPNSEPESLDPHKASDTGSFAVIRQMFVGLTAVDKDGKTIPGLAEDWSNVDNKVWTFKLRDAKWSNGDPITAHDFVYSLRRLMDPKTASPYSSYLVDARVLGSKEVAEGKAGVETLGIKAIDDKTLEITLTEAIPFLPDLLTLPVTYAVHQKTIEQHGDKWLDPANIVVSGAYKLKDWVVNGHIKLDRNEHYHDNANTKINGVEFLPITDASVTINRYKAGELDVASIPADQFKKIKEELPSDVAIAPKLCNTYLEFNHAKAPFDNAKVRKAISMVIDRETITEKVLGRGEVAAYQYTPSTIQDMGVLKPDWQALDKSARTAEAKKLLAEAGYGDSNPVNFELLYATSETSKRISSAVASMIKQELPMVNVSILNQEFKTSIETRRRGGTNAALAGWCADYNEPSTFLNVFRSGGSNNNSKYSNPEYDSLLDQALKATSTAERIKIYHQAEGVLDRDGVVANLYVGVSPYLVKPHLNAESLIKDPSGSWLVEDWSFK